VGRGEIVLNPDQYLCNVVIVGLMTSLSSPEGIPSVSIGGRDLNNQPTELIFRYGIGAIAFHGINPLATQTKELGIAEKVGIFVFFTKSENSLETYLI